MSWNPVWEQIFRTHDWGRYPPEELIRFVSRAFSLSPDRKQVKILELGCGTGANIWFLSREGFNAYGVDGSITGITKARRRLEEEGLKANLEVADICDFSDLYSGIKFDAIIDIACLQHNNLHFIQIVLDQIIHALNPNGKVFSMMVASGSYGDGMGREVGAGSFTNISEGPLQGKGLCHFFTLDEVQKLFVAFSDLRVEYSSRSLEDRQYCYKHWIIEGVKLL